MPPWMEILLNLIGYGGFIAIAQFHKRPNTPGPRTTRLSTSRLQR
jgi:hypothetical protein